MQKRGQFFLIAALIVSTVLFGLGETLNRAQAIDEDTTAQRLAEEISYESSQLLDRDSYNGITQDEIEANLLELSGYYSSSYPRAEFVIIYGKDNIKSKYYVKGQGYDFNSNITYNLANIVVSYGEASYDFKRHAGENYFIIVKTQSDYGKFIAVR